MEEAAVSLFERVGGGGGALCNFEDKPDASWPKWETLPQPIVVDSGAAITVIPNNWLLNHKTCESEGSRVGEFYNTADGTPVYNE